MKRTWLALLCAIPLFGCTPPAVAPKKWVIEPKLMSPAEVYRFGKHPESTELWADQLGVNCQGKPGKSCIVGVTAGGVRVTEDEAGRTVSRTTIPFQPIHLALRASRLFVYSANALWVATPASGPLVLHSELPALVQHVTVGKSAMFAVDAQHRLWRSANDTADWTMIRAPKRGGIVRSLEPEIQDVALDGFGNGLLLEYPPQVHAVYDDGARVEPISMDIPRKMSSSSAGVLVNMVDSKSTRIVPHMWRDGRLDPATGDGAGARTFDIGDPSLVDIHTAVAVGPYVVVVRKVKSGPTPHVYSLQLLGASAGPTPTRGITSEVIEANLRNCSDVTARAVSPVGRDEQSTATEVTFTCRDAVAGGRYRVYTAQVGPSGISTTIERATLVSASAEPVATMVPAGDGLWVGDFGCERRESPCAWFVLADNGVRTTLPISDIKLLHVVRTEGGIWLFGRRLGSSTTTVVRLLPNGTFVQRVDHLWLGFGESFAVRAVGEDFEIVSGGKSLRAALGSPVGRFKLAEGPWEGPEVLAFAGARALAMASERWLESSDLGKTFVDVGPSFGRADYCSSGACVGKDFARLGWDDRPAVAPSDAKSITASIDKSVKSSDPLYCHDVGSAVTLAAEPIGRPSIVKSCAATPDAKSKPVFPPIAVGVNTFQVALSLGAKNPAHKYHTDPKIGLVTVRDDELSIATVSLLGAVSPARRNTHQTVIWSDGVSAAAVRIGYDRVKGSIRPLDVDAESLDFLTGKRQRFSKSIGPMFLSTRKPTVMGYDDQTVWPLSHGIAFVGPTDFPGVGLLGKPFGSLAQPVDSRFLLLSRVGAAIVFLEGNTLVSRKVNLSKWPNTKSVASDVDSLDHIGEELSRIPLGPKSTVVSLGDRDSVAVLTARDDYFAFALYKLDVAGKLVRQDVEIASSLPACGPCSRGLGELALPGHPIVLDASGKRTLYSKVETLLGLEADRLCVMGNQTLGAVRAEPTIVLSGDKGFMYTWSPALLDKSEPGLIATALTCGKASP